MSSSALVSYELDGKLDKGFGTAGKLVNSFGPNTSSYGAAIAIQSDAKILTAGPVLFNGFIALSSSLDARRAVCRSTQPIGTSLSAAAPVQ